MSLDNTLVTHYIDGVPFIMSLKQKDLIIREQSKTSPDPVRLVMVRWIENCQFCSEPIGESKSSLVSVDSLMGFISCSTCEEKRLKACNEWIKKFGHGGAKSLQGKTIRVKRSSGIIEDDWELSTENYYTFIDDYGNKTVCCKKVGIDMTKYCQVSELLELNK